MSLYRHIWTRTSDLSIHTHLKIDDLKLRNVTFNPILLNIYIYIYIYMCVCVCVCEGVVSGKRGSRLMLWYDNEHSCVYIYIYVSVCEFVGGSLCVFVDGWSRRRPYLWHLWSGDGVSRRESLLDTPAPLCLLWREDHIKSCTRENLRDWKRTMKRVS